MCVCMCVSGMCVSVHVHYGLAGSVVSEQSYYLLFFSIGREE